MKMKLIAAGLVVAASSATVQAQDDESTWSIDGYVGVVTDYRDRGISLSNGDLSLVGSLGAFHKSGFYGGVDAAILNDGWIGDQRTEFFFGYSTDRGDYIYDVSVELDGIHGDATSDYYSEFKASIARDFGLAFIRAGAAYAPEGRWHTPDVDSFYSYADLEVPVPTLPELTVVTHLGYDMRDGRSNLWDWSVGLSAFIESFELSVTYEDSSLDHQIGGSQVVFGTRFYF